MISLLRRTGALFPADSQVDVTVDAGQVFTSFVMVGGLEPAREWVTRAASSCGHGGSASGGGSRGWSNGASVTTTAMPCEPTYECDARRKRQCVCNSGFS